MWNASLQQEGSIAATDWTEVTLPCPVCAEPAAATAAACGHCEAALYPEERLRRRYSLWRVGLLGILSNGLYFLYWYYVSWKHLKAETGDDHRPFWHVLTLFVPIYGLFRFHAHMRTIRDQIGWWNSKWGRGGVRATSNLSPGWATLIFWAVAAVGRGLAAMAETSRLEVYLGIGIGQPVLYELLATAVIVGLMVWAQANLNRYWQAASRGAVREAGFGAGEILVTLYGVSLLASTLLDRMLE